MVADDNSDDISLLFPMDCDLGKNCWLARYTDRQKGEGKADFQCGRRTQNGHKGTDFTLDNYRQMMRGVAVLAAADGIVTNTRDGMRDEPASQANKEARKKKGCGNAVVLKHSDMFETSYCHMKQGSVVVQKGDHVKAGQKIGEVGLSGDTEYPHLHFGLRKNGKSWDPFDNSRANEGCKIGGNGLWQEPMAYEGFTLMPLVFSSKPLTRRSRWQPQPDRLSSDADYLILTGRAWNVLVGDAWFFKIIRPDGTEASNRSMRVTENRQSQWYWNQIARPQGGFMPGKWTGHLRVTRRGKDGQLKTFEATKTTTVVRKD